MKLQAPYVFVSFLVFHALVYSMDDTHNASLSTTDVVVTEMTDDEILDKAPSDTCRMEHDGNNGLLLIITTHPITKECVTITKPIKAKFFCGSHLNIVCDGYTYRHCRYVNVLADFQREEINDDPVEFCNCGEHQRERNKRHRQSSRGCCTIN